MSKFKYNESERQINSVLKHQDETLAGIHFPSKAESEETLAKAEELLRSLGYQPDNLKGLIPVPKTKKVMV